MKPTINNTIAFWSLPEFYKKEKSGKKPNTVRYFNCVEPKFIMIKNGKAKFIKIKERKSLYPSFFIRKIKDVTYWKRLVIISW